MSNSIPIQLAPMLAVYEDDGEFTLRVSDSSLAKSVSANVIKAIGETAGARKLILVTPTDTKVFKFGDKKPSIDNKVVQMEPKKVPVHQIQDPSAPPSPEIEEYEREAAEATQLQRELEKDNATPVEFPKDDEPVEQVAPKTRKRTPRPQNLPTGCGRCGGQGIIAGGGTCPVCRGQGAVSHYK